MIIYLAHDLRNPSAMELERLLAARNVAARKPRSPRHCVIAQATYLFVTGWVASDCTAPRKCGAVSLEQSVNPSLLKPNYPSNGF